MVKLSADLILGAAQYVNPVKDRELDLRGYKIPLLENLGATLDQFDSIDFSDNELRKLDNFPYLPRLKTLFFNNNRIFRIAENLHQSLPNLTTLVLTNNNIQDLADIEALSCLQNVEMLSFLSNPVTSQPNYRAFVIHKFPKLRLLDFRKVKLDERQRCKAIFKSKEGQQQLRDVEQASKTIEYNDNKHEGGRGRPATNASGLSVHEVRQIKLAIARATTLQEIERLNHMLRTGVMPSHDNWQENA